MDHGGGNAEQDPDQPCGKPAEAEDLIILNARRAAGDPADPKVYEEALRAEVAAVGARQRDTGIDLVNDGEYGHSMA